MEKQDEDRHQQEKENNSNNVLDLEKRKIYWQGKEGEIKDEKGNKKEDW